jgi:small subunit ribosomal protein S3Ae
VRDKWRTKDWYFINSPSYFGGTNIGSTPSDDPEKLIGRVVSVTLYDLTGDFSQQHMKLFFQIVNLNGNDAETIFKGHEYSNDYLKSLVRRRSTRVDSIQRITTADGYVLRISTVVFTVKRINDSQKTSIRHNINKIVKEKAQSLNFDQFIQETVLGKIASDIYNEAKKIVPIRHIGIRKSKLLTYPESQPIEVTVNP